MRVLFVVPPLLGHLLPTLAVAAALRRRGAEVAWVGHPGVLRPRLPAGARLFELDDRVPEALQAEMLARARASRGLEAFRDLWQDFLLPLARAMVPGVEAAVEAFRPDRMLVDQQALAGALVARRRGLVWLTSATTSAGVSEPLAGLPAVARWLDERLLALQEEAGLAPLPQPDRSPHGVIVFSTEALTGPLPGPGLAMVGPAIRDATEPTDFPFERLDRGRPRVLASLGTVNADRGRRFFAELIPAIEAIGAQGILSGPPEVLGPLPDGFLAARWLPIPRLLPRVDLFVGHGGHNSTVEALYHGRPVLLAPIRDDQPVVAEQVLRAGVGLRVRFGRVRRPELVAELRRLLEEPAFAARAARVGQSFRAAGGAERAAELILRGRVEGD